MTCAGHQFTCSPVHAPRRSPSNPVKLMIKDVMVRLEGTVADDLRLAAAADIAGQFESHVVGLFLNIVPPPLPADPEGAGIAQTALLVEEARAAGDKVAKLVTARLAQSISLPTRSPASVPARPAQPIRSSPSVRTAYRRSPSTSSRTFSSALEGAFSWFRQASGAKRVSRTFSSLGTAAGRRRVRWLRPCRT